MVIMNMMIFGAGISQAIVIGADSEDKKEGVRTRLHLSSHTFFLAVYMHPLKDTVEISSASVDGIEHGGSNLVAEINRLLQLLIRQFGSAEQTLLYDQAQRINNFNTVLIEDRLQIIEAFITGVGQFDQSNVENLLSGQALDEFGEFLGHLAIFLISKDDQLFFVALVCRRNLIALALEQLAKLIANQTGLPAMLILTEEKCL